MGVRFRTRNVHKRTKVVRFRTLLQLVKCLIRGFGALFWFGTVFVTSLVIYKNFALTTPKTFDTLWEWIEK